MKVNKLFVTLVICAVAMVISSCSKSEVTVRIDRPIVILYDNDVHCSVDGYAKPEGRIIMK